MSRMSTEEDIELHIAPSSNSEDAIDIDAILEVSPVNSYSHYSNSSPAHSAASPTASLRHRRSQNNEAAFSSSSEGSSDEEEFDDNDSKRQPPPSSSISSRDLQLHSSNTPHSSTSSPHSSSGNNNSNHASQPHASFSPASSQRHRKGNSSNSIHKSRSQQAQSEFDKALLTGVPSRGHAASFFSADSTDASEAPFSITDALADPSQQTPQQQQLQTQTSNPQPSWDEGAIATDASLPTSTSMSSKALRHAKKKERKPHRVNITATTQSSSASVASVSSAASLPYPPSTSKNQHSNNDSIPRSSSGAALHRTSKSSTTHEKNTLRKSNSEDNMGDLSGGVLPDVLMTMRLKLESMQLFDSDMMKLASSDARHIDGMDAETRESLKRSSQQSISAAVLVSLAHKRYERRRLAAMEIEKVVRSLVQQNELERVRAILLLLSDDYVRSTSEDARKGGVVALAACAIGLKKAHDDAATVMECRDLILASVVHACQDHSQRVRYYATESLFNVVKVIPGLAVQHFFILFEILRSLYADVDVDVRSGAELLDKKLKEVIVGAMNSGSFSTDACVPVFARFVYMRNKATKRLTLTWLQELNEKLIGAPILEFLHLFLGGIFDMVADPSLAIRQSALAFLQSVLPKLLVVNSEAIDDMDDSGMKVDFDKILQSLVTTMEHPDPFVRKVAMYWMSRIVKAHMKELNARNHSNSNATKQLSSSGMMNPDGRLSPKHIEGTGEDEDIDEGESTEENNRKAEGEKTAQFSAASISVRNSLPHVLPGILLSIGDTFNAKSGSTKDSFLPDQTTNELAEQTNACLRDAVRRDGQAYVQHLDSFIVALREELDSPGGLSAKNPPAEERKLYRIDVNRDGTGIESPGWYRASNDTKERNEESMVSSRLCALHWVIVLYESVVPDALKAEYAQEFIIPIIHQLVDNPPEKIVFKSLEVLAKITVKVSGEDRSRLQQQSPHARGSSLSGFNTPPPPWASPVDHSQSAAAEDDEAEFPMTDANTCFALDILHPSRRKFKSRDREVFAALIQLHSYNQQLLADLSRVIAFMCRLQPPEFVFVSFAVELDRFVRRLQKQRQQEQALRQISEVQEITAVTKARQRPFSSDLEFVSSFVQQMCHVLLNAEEAKPLRDTLRDCVGYMQFDIDNPKEHRRVRLFHILFHSFSHSLVATVSLCLWGGAYRTASMFLSRIVPLDINLMFLLELDKLVEQLERPLFRHLHVRMLERNEDPLAEGSGAMLFKTLKFLLMIIPQSTCYNVLNDRLISISRFRQSTAMIGGSYSKARSHSTIDQKRLNEQTEVFVTRALKVRALHCDAIWDTIRSESLECHVPEKNSVHEEGDSRRQWLGYASKEEQQKAEERYRREKKQQGKGLSIEELGGYEDLGIEPTDSAIEQQLNEKFEQETNEYEDQAMTLGSRNNANPSKDMGSQDEGGTWKAYWEND